MYTFEQHSRAQQQLGIAVVCSILVHIGLFWGLNSIPARHPIEPLGEVIEVSFEGPVQRSLRPSSQIVSESERTEVRKLDIDTPNRAEKDSVVEKEQVRRGDDPQAGPSVSPVRSAQQQPSDPQANANSKSEGEQTNTKSPAPKRAVKADPSKSLPLKELKLDSATLLEKFVIPQAQKNEEQVEQANSRTAGYQAFSRPLGSGAAFLGRRGVTDYLPSLPDGDITTLNAKADQFAVFVRRVASSVFGQLRSAGWEQISGRELNSLSDFSEVRASLSLKGELLSVQVVSSSGSQRFDLVLNESVKRGARDPNPPAAAVASDGTIRFIFRARSWAQMSSSSRSGAPVERRWLLLATGLE